MWRNLLPCILLFLFQHPVNADCVVFAPVDPASECRQTSDSIVWLDPPRLIEVLQSSSSAYDPLLTDAALSKGVSVRGDVHLRFRGGGEYVVEIFLIALEEGKDSFVLEVNGKPVDTRFELKARQDRRLRPKRRAQHISLLGSVSNSAEITVRTDSRRYALSAIRWTRRPEFERALVSEYLPRSRYLLENPFDEEGSGYAFVRRDYLEQLYSRLSLSNQPKVRREGVIGLARTLYWLAAENHEPHDIERAREALEVALNEAPDDPIVRQTVTASCLKLNVSQGRPMPEGEFCNRVQPVPWKVAMPEGSATAPPWAVAQRRLARRMDAITRWWVEERQQANGELGGGWGDDVEILRSWGPQALGLGSSVAVEGIRTLADGLWNSGTLLHGYSREISDVEHASEPTTDTQPLLAAINPHGVQIRARLAQTASCARNWIALQPDGQWRFRGAWFNCHRFDPDPRRALDVHLNTRAMGPVLWYAYLSGDPGLISLLENWTKSWVQAMRSTRHRKPAGIFPSAVHSSNGSYLIGSRQWSKPDAEWDYFQWSGSAQEALTSLVLAIYDLTDEKQWLDAATESFQVLQNCDDHPRLCEEIIKAPGAFYVWRQYADDDRYDQLFGYRPNPNPNQVRSKMASLANTMEGTLSVNFDMFTSEVIFTDRVYYRWAPLYERYLFGGEAPRGDRYPTFAVTWPEVDGEFARLVVESNPVRLRLLAYNFEAGKLQIPVRIWRLYPGRYQWHMRDIQGELIEEGSMGIYQRASLLEFNLPSHREVEITITRMEGQ